MIANLRVANAAAPVPTAQDPTTIIHANGPIGVHPNSWLTPGVSMRVASDGAGCAQSEMTPHFPSAGGAGSVTDLRLTHAGRVVLVHEHAQGGLPHTRERPACTGLTGR